MWMADRRALSCHGHATTRRPCSLEAAHQCSHAKSDALPHGWRGRRVGMPELRTSAAIGRTQSARPAATMRLNPDRAARRATIACPSSANGCSVLVLPPAVRVRLSRTTTERAHRAQLALQCRAGEVMDTPESVEFADVEVVAEIGLSVVCLVNGKRVRVPMHEALAGSEMRWTRKRGKLVIRKELAVELGLV